MRYVYHLAVGYAVPKSIKGYNYRGFRIGFHTPSGRTLCRESFYPLNTLDAILWGIYEILSHAASKGYREIHIVPPGWSYKKLYVRASDAGQYARLYGIRFYLIEGTQSETDIALKQAAQKVVDEKFLRFVR
jgi:hypothetical protein